MSTIQVPYETITLKAAEKRGMLPLYGPCGPEEYPMLDRAVNQLTKNGSRIAYAYVVEGDNPEEITVFRKTSGE